MQNKVPFDQRKDPFVIAIVHVILFLSIVSLGDFAEWIPSDAKKLQEKAVYSLIRFDSADDMGVYIPLKSTIIDGDLDYVNEQSYWWHNNITETGRAWNVSYQIGSSFLWFPFFMIGHFLAHVMNYFGIAFSPNGFSTPYFVMTGIGSAAYGCWGSIILYSSMKRFFRREAALLVASTGVIISNLCYFTFVRSRKEHTSEYFSVSLFLWVMFRFMDSKNKTISDYMFLGISAGLMVLVRLNAMVLCIIPFILFIQEAWDAVVRKNRPLKDVFRGYGTAFACFCIIISPMFIHAKIISGNFFNVGGF